MTLHFLIFMLLISRIKAQTEQCYAEIDSPHLYFGTRTSYFASRGSEMNTPRDCQPVYVWGLLRHGTRYPDTPIIELVDKLRALRDEIIRNHKNGRGNLCEKDLQNLAKWSSNLISESVQEFDLAPQGVKDEIFLAQQIKKEFPELAKSSLKNNFTFQNSGESRTRKSAIVFANELLGTNFNTTEGNNIAENGAFLQPTLHCLKFAKSQKDSSTEAEVNLFKKTAYFQKIIAEISIRLGYLQSLSIESIQLIHDICAYENAWNLGSRPPFCAAFLPNEVEAFNYMNDMYRYHKRGYANPLAHRSACPIVRDLITSLIRAGQNLPLAEKGKFLFSHSETILSVTARLGLSKDEEPLRHDNYQTMINNRKWKLSFIDSFAANIIAVLYKCSSGKGTQSKVVIYQNERPAVIPQCNNSSICSLETLKEIYSDVLSGNQCDTTFCQLSDSQTASSSAYSMLLIWNSSTFSIILILVFFFNA